MPLEAIAEQGASMTVDVAIIGAGPAGLAAAIHLRKRGVNKVVVFDREADGGGIPRHCGHPPFGLLEFKRLLTGPQYARRLVQQAQKQGVNILLRHSVTQLLPGGELRLTTPDGLLTVSATRVLLATGIRETPRSARLVSGERPQGVMTTGAFQSLFYLKGLVPFRRPLIVGSELVSFSAILTAAKGKVQPVAMIESGSRITARHPLGCLPFIKRIPLHLNTRLESIQGSSGVERVVIQHQDSGVSTTLACDGVLFTGKFIPEATLIRNSHLSLDPNSQGPEIDQTGRCSDPAYFAAGNLLRAVETAGWSYREGRAVGGWIADDLQGKFAAKPQADTLSIHCQSPIKLVVPQRILPGEPLGFSTLQLRLQRAVNGTLIVAAGQQVLHRKRISALPERRLALTFGHWKIPANCRHITLRVEE